MTAAEKAVIAAALRYRSARDCVGRRMGLRRMVLLHDAGEVILNAVDALLRDDPAWGEQCGVCAGPVTAEDPPEPVGEGLSPERTCASCREPVSNADELGGAHTLSQYSAPDARAIAKGKVKPSASYTRHGCYIDDPDCGQCAKERKVKRG